MTVTMNNAVLWDVTPCGSCNNQRFGVTYPLHHQGEKISKLRTSVTSKSIPRSWATSRKTTFFIVTAVKNFKPYIALTGYAL
jgi:hypothetical protein